MGELDPGRTASHTWNDGLPTVLDFAFQIAVGGMAAEGKPTGDAFRLFRGDVLRPRSLDQMLDFEATADLPCPLVQQCAPGYGLGMEQSHLNAWTVWQHSGSTGALLTHFARQGVTIAVVTNGAPGASGGQFFATRALVDALPGLAGRSAVFAIDADGWLTETIAFSTERDQIQPIAPALIPVGAPS